jgi:hypothetical protein
MDTYNVIATKWLAKKCLERTMLLPSGGDSLQAAGPEAGSAVQVITKLRASIEARVPLGYEDENGFHFGADATD